MTRAEVKAAALQRIASHTGSPQSGFVLTLTDEEAFEYLECLAQGTNGWFACHKRFVMDVESAKVTGNPWSVLTGFQIGGFELASVVRLH